jgi:hypothetical protein
MDERAVAQLEDAVRDIEHRRVVGRDDRGDLLGPDDRPQELHDHVPGVGIELARRLVGEEEARLVRQGPGEGDALLLAAGELVRAVPRAIAQPDDLEEIGDPPVSLAWIGVDEAERDLDVLARGQEWDEPERLEDERHDAPADPDQLALVHRRDLVSVDDDAARGRLVEAAEQVEERCLAAPRSAADGDELAAPDGKVDPAQGVDDALADRVIAGQLDRLDHRFAGPAGVAADRRLDPGRVDGLEPGARVVHFSAFAFPLRSGQTPT